MYILQATSPLSLSLHIIKSVLQASAPSSTQLCHLYAVCLQRLTTQCNYFHDLTSESNSIKCKHEPINTPMNMSKAHKTIELYIITLWQTMICPYMVPSKSTDMLMYEST